MLDPQLSCCVCSCDLKRPESRVCGQSRFQFSRRTVEEFVVEKSFLAHGRIPGDICSDCHEALEEVDHWCYVFSRSLANLRNRHSTYSRVKAGICAYDANGNLDFVRKGLDQDFQLEDVDSPSTPTQMQEDSEVSSPSSPTSPAPGRKRGLNLEDGDSLATGPDVKKTRHQEVPESSTECEERNDSPASSSGLMKHGSEDEGDDEKDSDDEENISPGPGNGGVDQSPRDEPPEAQQAGRRRNEGRFLPRKRGPLKKHPCPECGYGFTSTFSLRRHRATQHGVQPEEKYIQRCQFCPKVYYDKPKFREHVNKHLGVQPHQCPSCSYRTHKDRCLRNHTVKAHGAKLTDIKKSLVDHSSPRTHDA